MQLYYSPLSTFSQKVMIAFNEKGVGYTPELVDLGSAEGRAAYEKIYPIGKVPFLKPTPDWLVPESTSIIEYLEGKFPDTPRLIPAGDADAARQVRFMDRLSDLYFNEPIIELLLQKIGLRTGDAAREERARKHISVTYSHWEQRLASRSWLCGEQFTMADCAAIPAMFYAQMVAPFGTHSNIVAYWQRAQQRPSYQKVRAEFEPIWQQRMAAQEAA
jgi:glutathione S-transferase